MSGRTPLPLTHSAVEECTFAHLQVLLQETAWTEANVATQLGVRRIALNAMPHEAGAEDEPVFCWETVMKVDHLSLHLTVFVLLSSIKADEFGCSVTETNGHFVKNRHDCWSFIMQAFHWAFLSYRYEEHKGDDAAVAHTDEPDALVVSTE